jgi:hypothetical protein
MLGAGAGGITGAFWFESGFCHVNLLMYERFKNMISLKDINDFCVSAAVKEYIVRLSRCQATLHPLSD